MENILDKNLTYIIQNIEFGDNWSNYIFHITMEWQNKRSIDLCNNLWPEVINIACYIINLHTSKLFLHKTLEELFLKQKSDISKLCVFSMIIYVYESNP